MSDLDMNNSCGSCDSSSSCSGTDCSTCGGCSTDADQHSTITLTMEDDTEVECAILTIFPVDAKEYIALLPEDDDTVLIYQYNEDGEEVELSLIEDDDTFEKVSQAFDELWEDEDEE